MPEGSDEFLRLGSGQFAGDQLADRANLRSQFLGLARQLKLLPLSLFSLCAVSRRSGDDALSRTTVPR